MSDNETDMNRNFPYGWQPEPHQLGAGRYALSEPESRAVTEFATDHPNIFAWLSLHTFGGVYIRPAGDKPDKKMDPNDLALFRQIEEWGQTIAGYPSVNGFEEFTYEPDKPLCGDLSTFATDRTFDVVAIWNTFDLLADPRGTVTAAHRLLAPGGVIAIRVPNGACYAALRRRLDSFNPIVRATARAVLAQNNLLGFPYRWGFTPRALTRLLGEVGFSVRDVRGDVLVRVADEWTRAWAALEEAAIKRALGAAVRRAVAWAPWIEVYAIRA